MAREGQEEMSKLEKLLANLCPNGVEYKPLDEVCRIEKGIQFNKTDMLKQGTYPVINGGTGPSGFIEKFNQQGKTTTISQGGASAGWVNWLETDFWAGAHCYVVKAKPDVVLSRYVYYFVKSQERKLQECQYGAGIPALAKSTVAQLEIPVPPLEVQEEIVRILDAFTELTAELTAELRARQQQYEHYRDALLSFDDVNNKLHTGGVTGKAVAWKTLGEIATFTYGLTDKSKANGALRYIRITDINDDGLLKVDDARYVESSLEAEKFRLKRGDLLVARTGATYGKTLYVQDDNPAVYASFLIKIALDESLIKNRYYWHFSKSTSYWKQANALVSQGGQPQFNSNALCKIRIPLPPLDVQQRIVETLDRFDSLVNSISEGLPAEIEARRKQYEFYRDKLLSFKRVEVA